MSPYSCPTLPLYKELLTTVSSRLATQSIAQLFDLVGTDPATATDIGGASCPVPQTIGGQTGQPVTGEPSDRERHGILSEQDSMGHTGR